jgi:hypothetical protein
MIKKVEVAFGISADTLSSSFGRTDWRLALRSFIIYYLNFPGILKQALFTM